MRRRIGSGRAGWMLFEGKEIRLAVGETLTLLECSMCYGGLERAGDGDGVAAGFVAGGEADVDLVGHGGAGDGEAGAGEEIARLGGAEGVKGGGVVRRVV